jgi:hypothetical protein
MAPPAKPAAARRTVRAIVRPRSTLTIASQAPIAAKHAAVTGSLPAPPNAAIASPTANSDRPATRRSPARSSTPHCTRQVGLDAREIRGGARQRFQDPRRAGSSCA